MCEAGAPSSRRSPTNESASTRARLPFVSYGRNCARPRLTFGICARVHTARFTIDASTQLHSLARHSMKKHRVSFTYFRLTEIRKDEAYVTSERRPEGPAANQRFGNRRGCARAHLVSVVTSCTIDCSRGELACVPIDETERALHISRTWNKPCNPNFCQRIMETRFVHS